MKQFEFIVLGSGIAGLSFALKVAKRGRVAIVTKKDRAESNTNYAQGGIADQASIPVTLAGAAVPTTAPTARQTPPTLPPSVPPVITVGPTSGGGFITATP